MWPELGKVFSVGTKKALYANQLNGAKKGQTSKRDQMLPEMTKAGLSCGVLALHHPSAPSTDRGDPQIPSFHLLPPDSPRILSPTTSHIPKSKSHLARTRAPSRSPHFRSFLHAMRRAGNVIQHDQHGLEPGHPDLSDFCCVSLSHCNFSGPQLLHLPHNNPTSYGLVGGFMR